MEEGESAVKEVLSGLWSYLYNSLPPNEDFIIQLQIYGIIERNDATKLCASARLGGRACIQDLITFMYDFFDEPALETFCTFLDKYGQTTRPLMLKVAAKIREEIRLKLQPVHEPAPEDPQRGTSWPRADVAHSVPGTSVPATFPPGSSPPESLAPYTPAPTKVLLSSPVAAQRRGWGEDGPSSSQSTTSERSNKVFSDEDAASRLGIAVAALDLSKGTSQQTCRDAYLAKDPPHSRVVTAFCHLQSRLASVFNMHCDFAELKLFLRLRQKNEEWPFKELEVGDIDSMKDIRTIFGKICINWLNTEAFIRLIDVLPDKKSHEAKQHLEVYHKLLGVFSKYVLLSHIPKDDARLEHFHSCMFPKLRVTYDVNMEDFDVSKLLKEQNFLSKLFHIPKEAFHYLIGKCGSTLVTWALAISIEKAIKLFQRVTHEFWSLKEHLIIKVEIESDGIFQLHMHMKGRNSNLHYQLKKALQGNQDLLVCTEHVSRQFLALVDYSHLQRKGTEPRLQPALKSVLQPSGPSNVAGSETQRQARTGDVAALKKSAMTDGVSLLVDRLDERSTPHPRPTHEDEDEDLSTPTSERRGKPRLQPALKSVLQPSGPSKVAGSETQRQARTGDVMAQCSGNPSRYAATKPTERDLKVVADHAGSNWSSLLTNLYIPWATIEKMRSECSTNLWEACTRGLVLWLNGGASDSNEPVTFGTLFAALKDSGMAECVALLVDRLDERCTPHLRPTHEDGDEDLSTPTSKSREEKKDTVLREVATQVQEDDTLLQLKYEEAIAGNRHMQEMVQQLQDQKEELEKEITTLKETLSKDGQSRMLAEILESVKSELPEQILAFGKDSAQLQQDKLHAAELREKDETIARKNKKIGELELAEKNDLNLALVALRSEIAENKADVLHALKELGGGGGPAELEAKKLISHFQDVPEQLDLIRGLLEVPLSSPEAVQKGGRDGDGPSSSQATTKPKKEQDKELPHEDSASNSWVKQYEKVIRERDSVKVDITRCVLIGPARVGKSSLKQLLVHNEPRPVHKSTDLMEAPVALASMYHQSEGSGWELLTVDNLKQMLKKSTAEGEYNSPSTAAVQELHQESGSIQSSGTDHPSKLPSTVPKKDDCLADLKSQFSRFVEGLESVGDTHLIMNGLQLIHLFDCGGQLAFQDAIPCLIHAPCAFIAVFDASVDLEEVKEWTYCPHEGSKEVGRGHRESQWNILSRIFSSIHSLQCKCRDDLKKLIKDKLSSPWPIAVVGTHNDELKQHKDFGTINKSIISHFADVKKSKPYSFLQPEPPDLVENKTVPMDDACTKTINRLRQQFSKKASFSVDLPLSWLFLELFTRTQHPKLLFISYEDLRTLCNHEKLITEGDEEFESLLRVLHALGFYAFYPLKDLGVPLSLDQNWVCTDAATLYKEVSKLLMVQYTVDKPETDATKYLKDEGKIVLNGDSLRELFDELKIGKINDEIDRVFSPRWLILVLVYIGLAAKFKRGGIEQVFIPLVLPFKGYDLPPVTELSVATLFLTLEFPSGPSMGSVTPILTDLPCGIFSRLVVLLLSEESECRLFEIFAEDSDRACVKLKPSKPKGGYVLYLKNHPNYVEVALQVKKSASKDHCKVAEKVYEICQSLRQTLTSFLTAAFFKLFGEQPPEKAVTARCGFKCTCKKSVKDHLAVMIMEEQFFFECVFKKREYFLESENCNLSEMIWFCPVPAKVSLKDGSDIWVMDDPSSSDLGKRSPAKTPSSVSKRQPPVSGRIKSISDLLPFLNSMLPHLGQLGPALGNPDYAKAIIDGPGSNPDKCQNILQHWLHCTPAATWDLLCDKLTSSKVQCFTRLIAEIQEAQQRQS